MLDQLVESKTGKSKSRGGFMLATFVLVFATIFSAGLYSLFAKDYAKGMGGDGLDLTTLVAPPVIEEAPPPEPEEEPKPEESRQKDPNVDVRTEVIQRMDESPQAPPDKISTTQNKIPPRDPNKYTALGNQNLNASNAPSADYRGRTNTTGSGSDSGLKGGGGNDEGGSSAPPPPPPPPVEKPKPPSRPISGGVLNGKATSLPKPAYPPAAKAVRASGTVSVQVTIDESGRVISAKAVSGHALLRSAAEGAARGARFSPTMLSGQAVKVAGVITYNFVP